jgi:hypothetical protein
MSQSALTHEERDGLTPVPFPFGVDPSAPAHSQSKKGPIASCDGAHVR